MAGTGRIGKQRRGDRKALILTLFLLAGTCITAAFHEGRIAAQAQDFGIRSPYCTELEQELAQLWRQRNQPNTNIPKLREEIRNERKKLRRAESEADRRDCYETALFFGTSLRRTRRCIRLDRQIQRSRRALTRLEDRLHAQSDHYNTDNRRDRLVDALARNGCGRQYQQETRRRSGGFFNDLFGGDDDYFNPTPRYDGRQTNHILPYATYRTMCVRKCDGYYYPVSYSTLSTKFAQDADQCASTCAAPAELFIYRNPGEEVEHMVSLDGFPYSQLPNAWKYRKEFVKGCSCKQAEYNPGQENLENLDQSEGDSSNRTEIPQDQRSNHTATVTARNVDKPLRSGR